MVVKFVEKRYSFLNFTKHGHLLFTIHNHIPIQVHLRRHPGGRRGSKSHPSFSRPIHRL